MKPVRYTKPALPEYLYGQTSAEATETETEITNVYGCDTSDDINIYHESNSDTDSDECGTSDNEYGDVDYSKDEDVSDFESD